MKSARRPLLILALLWCAFAAYVWLTAAQLPERVATHFGTGGEPNGWMTRTGHVQFTLLFGLAIPAFVIGIFALIRRLQGRGLNIPHKDYWLAPERRQETFDFLTRQSFWFAALFMAFLAGIHHSILLANARTPAMLPASNLGWLAGGFLVATLAWTIILVGRFCRRAA